jgi:hypothetical protein
MTKLDAALLAAPIELAKPPSANKFTESVPEVILVTPVYVFCPDKTKTVVEPPALVSPPEPVHQPRR